MLSFDFIKSNMSSSSSTSSTSSLSYPKNAIFNLHAKTPRTREDVKQLTNTINLVVPSIFVGNFDFEPENNDKVTYFIENLPNYIIPQLRENATTRKQHGYHSLQWNKVGVSVESRKDMIGFDKNIYTVEDSFAFPELDKLNTPEWPADHQCIVSMARETKTNLNVLVVSFKKVKVWKCHEWMGENDYTDFGNNSEYFPPLDDICFYTNMNCIYPKAVFEKQCWNTLISAYNMDNELGMGENIHVTEWSKPNDQKCHKFTYPTITYENQTLLYHTWSFIEFKHFLKIHPTNPERYTVLDFTSWSKKWFEITGYNTPIEGGGTYNVNHSIKYSEIFDDTGINLGMRIYQYLMTWFTLYKLDQHPIITNNIENFMLKIKYKRAFIGTFGIRPPYSRPNIHTSNYFDIEKHRMVLSTHINEKLKPYIMLSDLVFINLQEDWEFNNHLKITMKEDDDIQDKFPYIEHLWKACPEQKKEDIDVSTLVMKSKKLVKVRDFTTVTFTEEYILPTIENESVIRGKTSIETVFEKNLILQSELQVNTRSSPSNRSSITEYSFPLTNTDSDVFVDKSSSSSSSSNSWWYSFYQKMKQNIGL